VPVVDLLSSHEGARGGTDDAGANTHKET